MARPKDSTVPLTPLEALLHSVDKTQADLSRTSGISRSTISRLATHNRWVFRGAAAHKERVIQVLGQYGISPERAEAALPPLPGDPVPQPRAPQVNGRAHFAPADFDPENPNPEETTAMLIQFTALSQAAKVHFGLPRSPFVDDIQTRDDIYQSPSIRLARAALMDAATNAGFVALVGESGAGKTTLVDELRERLRDEGRDVVVVAPYTLAMEASDTNGKTLRSTHIAEALINALDPAATMRGSAQAQFRQLEALLTESRRSGRHHLLLIDEAHCLAVPTFSHLKRFIELKDGLKRLLGVALVAQPELLTLLRSNNRKIREVIQRLEVVQLGPLDAELEPYLRHKLARFDIRFEDVFAPDAMDAVRARLIHRPRGATARDCTSLCYPLAVANFVTTAMNRAAEVSWPKVDAQLIEGL